MIVVSMDLYLVSVCLNNTYDPLHIGLSDLIDSLGNSYVDPLVLSILIVLYNLK